MSPPTGKAPAPGEASVAAGRAICVAGPTCSGKSALALDLAARIGGAIINADSMQVYRELRVLTARPSAADEARIPHRLYGVRPAAEAASVAWWRKQALEAMGQVQAAGLVPILCGGTGLYFASLLGGLAEIPDPGAEARSEARGLLAGIGPAALHARLLVADPATATRLRPTDSQRLARAWEVWRGTGIGLAAWQSQPPVPDHAWSFFAVVLDPPRAALRPAIASRFDTMLEHGALAEVDALLEQGLDPALPAMRAHGVPELAAYRRHVISLAEARMRATQATARYTKRQATWFRHRHIADEAHTHRFLARYECETQETESLAAEILRFLCGRD